VAPERVDVLSRARLLQAVSSISEYVGEAALGVADAIDDLADVARDLEEVQRRWKDCPEDALWHFAFLYRAHWGGHLRSLQVYLHDRRGR
jgi:hypothetical protein